MQRLIAVLLIALLAFPNPAWAAQATAVFAGGCFWCLEHDLEHLPGVIEATSGYSGGQVERPTYRQVSSETTGHQEAVQVRFDPDQISYAELLCSAVTGAMWIPSTVAVSSVIAVIPIAR